MRGFLVLQTLEGTTIADGELTQVARGDQVRAHLIFRFKDGSIYEDTTTYSQRGSFRLVSDRLVRRGPSFPHPMETSIDASTNQVTVRSTEDKGREEVVTERIELPPDVANGLLLTLLKHIRPNVSTTTVSMLAFTPKPRLVKLVISPVGQEAFSIGSYRHKAWHFVVKVEIGGVAGLLAPVLKKQPPDIHVWILAGEAPAFVKLEGPLYEGGPIWRVQLAGAGTF